MGQTIEFKGIVKHVSTPIVSKKNDKTYESVTIVIEEQGEQYPSSIAFTALNKPEEVAKCQIGSDVKATINVQAREWGGKWFTNLNVWKIEVLAAAKSNGAQFDPKANYDKPQPNSQKGDGDLPF